ncbi:MAG: hypothetical protein WC838_06555 [Candidatus Margulisiibacteriota bacterium]|jgi:hypothetical protein
MEMTYDSVKAALREVLKEEMAFGACEIANKWQGGTMILKPHDYMMQPKEIPLEMFFKKITSVREKLRVLEQKVNNNPVLPNEDKVEFQQLISRAYGSLTTFNILFRDEKDKFVGVKGEA